jgi:hypothetical protein
MNYRRSVDLSVPSIGVLALNKFVESNATSSTMLAENGKTWRTVAIRLRDFTTAGAGGGGGGTTMETTVVFPAADKRTTGCDSVVVEVVSLIVVMVGRENAGAVGKTG